MTKGLLGLGYGIRACGRPGKGIIDSGIQINLLKTIERKLHRPAEMVCKNVVGRIRRKWPTGRSVDAQTKIRWHATCIPADSYLFGRWEIFAGRRVERAREPLVPSIRPTNDSSTQVPPVAGLGV